MAIRFYTDPHLGVSRTANTTQASSKALQQQLYDQAARVSSGDELTICLGDMFDNFSNPEAIHKQGMAVLNQTHMTLCGNHDVVNQAGKLGTLELLNNHLSSLTGQSRVLFSEFGKPSAHSWRLENEQAVLVFVPHVASQELFEESLAMAGLTALAADKGFTTVLCLHCNYNFPEERLNEATLNLTKDMAETMLDKFDYVLMGHEHIPAEHFGGRLIILGNTHPTSLSDISDKRIAFFENGRLRFEKIWDKSKGYAEFDCDALPTQTEANFARVKGEVDAGGMLNVMKDVSAMWRRSPNLYVLKMEVAIKGSPASSSEAMTGLAQLPALIRKELEETPDLLALWDELRGE